MPFCVVVVEVEGVVVVVAVVVVGGGVLVVIPAAAKSLLQRSVAQTHCCIWGQILQTNNHFHLLCQLTTKGLTLEVRDLSRTSSLEQARSSAL